MLMRFDPFRDFDRLTREVWGPAGRSPFMALDGRSPSMAMDAYRQGDRLVVQFDLPGVDPASIDLTVEKDVLTVTAERHWTRDEGEQVLVSERGQGSYSRQLFLGKALDTDHIEARYDNGVLTVTIPVAEQAKPRKVAIETTAA